MSLNDTLIKSECPIAYELLNCLAYLNGCNIPRELIETIFNYQPTHQFEAALKYLLSKSIIVLNKENRFFIDESIQNGILDKQSASSNDFLQNKIICALNVLLGRVEPNTLYEQMDKTRENLFYQALHVLEKTNLIDENIAELYVKVGLISEKYLIEYRRALKYYLKALDIYENIDPLNNLSIAFLLQYLGNVYFLLESNNISLIYYKKSLKLIKQHFSDETSEIGDILHNIGNVYFQQNKFDIAIEHYYKAMNIYEKSLPSNHLNLANSLHNIGRVLDAKKRYEEALDFYSKAIQIKKELLFKDLSYVKNNENSNYFPIDKKKSAKNLNEINRSINSLSNITLNHKLEDREYTVDNSDEAFMKEYDVMDHQEIQLNQSEKNNIFKDSDFTNDELIDNQEEKIEILGHRGIQINKTEEEDWTGEIPISEYPINEDPNFEIINQKPIFKQEVFIKYLRPPTPPSPGPIIIIQEPDIIAEPAPPIRLQQKIKPIILREAPPPFPENIDEKIIKIPGKILGQPLENTERNSRESKDFSPIIIEKWLPYPTVKRRVHYVDQEKTSCDSNFENIKHSRSTDIDVSENGDQSASKDILEPETHPKTSRKSICHLNRISILTIAFFIFINFIYFLIN